MSVEADDLDRATELAQWMTDSSVARVQRAARPEQVQRADGTWPTTECVECGDGIPAGRLALGKTRCVRCQEWIEGGSRK